MAEQDPSVESDPTFTRVDLPSADLPLAGQASPVGREKAQTAPARGDLEPRWLVFASLVAVAFLVLVFWSRPARQPPASSAAVTVAAATSPAKPPIQETTSTAAPARSAALPTSTPMAGATLVLPTATPTTFVLPTATPTALPSELLQRSLDISGRVSLTLTLENASFQSNGRPLRVGLDRNTYLLNPEAPTAEEHWCRQLGLVHLRGDLRYTLDPITGDVRADGNLKLVSDFCDAPGAVQFIAPVSLLFPADSVTPVVEELTLSRRLFDVPGLLDSQATVSLELTVINSIAEQ